MSDLGRRLAERESVHPDIGQLLREVTTVFRKGDVVVDEPSGAISVYGYEHTDDAPSDLTMVDCHFIVVGVKRQMPDGGVEAFAKWLASYPEPERLAGGPSYIELGGVLGSQEYAFRLMALGQVLGVWKVITPERLGLTGDAARGAAGRGFVMITGWPER